MCAEFHDAKGKEIYRIMPADRLAYKDDAPEEIRDDLLFRMLVIDGSIEVIETVARQKKLESDPMAGAAADGRGIAASGGGSSGDSEVSGVFTTAASGRSKVGETLIKRPVRRTVATIEDAEITCIDVHG